MKLKPRDILKANLIALKNANPKKRDHARYRVRIAEVLVVLSKKRRAA